MTSAFRLLSDGLVPELGTFANQLQLRRIHLLGSRDSHVADNCRRSFTFSRVGEVGSRGIGAKEIHGTICMNLRDSSGIVSVTPTESDYIAQSNLLLGFHVPLLRCVIRWEDYLLKVVLQTDSVNGLIVGHEGLYSPKILNLPCW